MEEGDGKLGGMDWGQGGPSEGSFGVFLPFLPKPLRPSPFGPRPSFTPFIFFTSYAFGGFFLSMRWPPALSAFLPSSDGWLVSVSLNKPFLRVTSGGEGTIAVARYVTGGSVMRFKGKKGS